MPEQMVSVECATCHEHWSAPVADVPEDAALSQVARDFLEQHKACAEGISIRLGSL